MIQRICPCGTSFEVRYPSSKKLNCTRECRASRKRSKRSDAGLRRTEWATKQCPCGELFEVPRWAVEGKGRVYCSDECRKKYAAKPKGRPSRAIPNGEAVSNGRYIRQRYINDEGYTRVYVLPDDRAPGYEKISHSLEHRVVMAGILGRHLLPNENVHHKNGNKSDNRPSNLELWVTKQPKGQRAKDLLDYAREIIALYEPIEPLL